MLNHSENHSLSLRRYSGAGRTSTSSERGGLQVDADNDSDRSSYSNTSSPIVTTAQTNEQRGHHAGFVSCTILAILNYE